MTPLPATPPSAPAISAAQAATAPPDTDDASGFAAVLQAQMGLPAKVAPGTEIFAALASPGSAADRADAPLPEAAPPVPDLAALLSAVAGLAPQAAAPPPAAIGTPPEETAARLSATGASPSAPTAGTPARPVLPTPLSEAPSTIADASLPAQPAKMAAAPTPAEAAATPISMEMPMAPAAAEMAGTAAAAPAAAILDRSAAAGDGPASMRIDTPVGSRGWDAEVGQKVVLMVNRSESRAELTLTPPQLGRVEVTIAVEGDRTSAAFVAASPAAREALEQALPRLREILADAGIALGQASVNAESPRREADPPSGQARDDRPAVAAPAPAAVSWLRRSEGLIDTFA
ncbi:Flagellar hook-length control protein [Gammaproteobacteria bacterium]|nr:Flagellar hook-length control protein [Gammaproteobacteria bacterium]